MATINRYVIVREDDTEEDFEFEYLDNAKEEAEERAAKGERLAIIERQYEYSDSELVWTSNGKDRWPPNGKASRLR